MAKDAYTHGKEHQLWLAATSAGLDERDNEVTGYVKDSALAQTRSQSQVTTAGDRAHEYGPPGQADGKLSLSGPWTKELDKIVSEAITRDEPLWWRYRPTGTGIGRVQFQGTLVVTGQNDTAPDGIMTIAVDTQIHDLSYERTNQGGT